MSDMKQLFTIVKRLKGRGLTQAEVDEINAALAREIVLAAKCGMRASPAGVALIHRFETLRLNAYRDPGSRNGLPITCGWGTTVDEDGGPIALGAVWTREKADRLFARDLAMFETGVNVLLASAPTSQGQFDALVSFAYNAGLDNDGDGKAEGLGDSTLLRKHKAGDFAGAAAEFAKWKHNDGVVMEGLIRRRAAEVAMYRGQA